MSFWNTLAKQSRMTKQVPIWIKPKFSGPHAPIKVEKIQPCKKWIDRQTAKSRYQGLVDMAQNRQVNMGTEP